MNIDIQVLLLIIANRAVFYQSIIGSLVCALQVFTHCMILGPATTVGQLGGHEQSAHSSAGSALYGMTNRSPCDLSCACTYGCR